MYSAFILTSIAGFSTLLGIIPIFIKVKNKDNIIAMSCAFASGVMFSLSVLDLIPESINLIKFHNKPFITIIIVFSFMLIGIITSMLLEGITNKMNQNNNLYQVGILSMLAIIIHNIPEGIVTYTVSSKNIILGLTICLAIALHNIPEGISIAVPLYFATKSKFKAIFYTFISSVSELFGAILTYLFLGKFMNDLILGIIFAFTGGIMLALSYDKLLPTSINYHKKLAYMFFIIGFIFMIISLQLNNLIS